MKDLRDSHKRWLALCTLMDGVEPRSKEQRLILDEMALLEDAVGEATVNEWIDQS